MAQGFRVTLPVPNYSWSVDLWVDAKTKRVVLLHDPSLDEFDPDNDPARNNPPGMRRSRLEAAGKVARDFVYDQELDDSLFSVEAPEGYTITTKRVPKPRAKQRAVSSQ